MNTEAQDYPNPHADNIKINRLPINYEFPEGDIDDLIFYGIELRRQSEK